MRKQILTFFILYSLASTVMASNLTQRPEYFGRELPYPTYFPAGFAWPPAALFKEEEIFRLQLRVNQDGRVDSLILPQALSARAPKYVRQLTDSLRFASGSVGGASASMWMYAELRVFGRNWLPSLTLPLDSTGNIVSPDLYFESIALNGVSLPKLVDFPRFACYFQPGDSIFAVPTSIIAVDLNEKGDVVKRTLLRSNNLLPDNQILSALLWSKFRPAIVDGIAQSARIYVTASCFPLQDKPVDPFGVRLDSLRDMFREYQVKVRYDTLGFLLPAIPRRALPSRMVIQARGEGSRGPFTTVLRVDTLGKAYSAGASTPSAYRRNLVKTLVRDLKFHPALNWQGQAVPFSGLVRIDPTNAPTIRIDYFW